MKIRNVCHWLLITIVVVILISPLAYWLTGIGQSAAGLSAEVARQADGTLVSSSKAEALHRLSLPMWIERLLIYPLLLFCFQLGGGALALRRWLERQVGPVLSGRFPWLVRGLSWIGRLIPRPWQQRVAGHDLLVIFLFVLVFDGVIFLVYLPFNLYGGFILAHQFGISTQTAMGWTTDQIKSLLIELVVSGLLWTGFYGLMRLMPRRWPIPAGAMMILVNAFFVVITPILITPLFYEVRPLDDPALRARVLALADRAGMHVEEVYVIDASSKTTRVNAYFTGFGGARRIVLYDTLLSGYTPDQVEVVLAHEMGHWYYQHVLLGLLGMGVVGWIGLFCLQWLLNRSWRRLGLSVPADVAGLPYLIAVVSVAAMLSLPFQNGITRYLERQADHFSFTVSGKPGVFIEMFEKFALDNLSMVDVPTWEKLVFYTHPTIVERIRAAEVFQGDKEHR